MRRDLVLTERDVADLREMRRLQKEYFRTRDSRLVASAKKAEAQVDLLLARLAEAREHPALELEENGG